MIELANTVLEWTGINVFAAQIMAWLTANGALGLLIIAGLGVVLVILGGIVLIHKVNRIPVEVPYARVLIPLAIVMAMLVLLIVAGMGVAMYWRESSPPSHSSQDSTDGASGMIPRHAIKLDDPDYYPDFGH